jgi:hypothetical protein
MKDYSRKQHNDYQYRDWLGIKTSKSIWNSILVQNPGHAEFSNMRESRSSLDAAVADFLRQSELKKPYKSPGFVEMEDVWEGPPGFSFNPLSGFDQPWTLVNPVTEPWTIIFDLISVSTYCPGETSDFLISGTEPIYLLELSGERPGTSMVVIGGYGTNEVIGTITADEDEKGSINFNGSMTSFEGVVGSSNYLMPKGRDCCDPNNPMEADPGTTPETIVQGQTVLVGVIKGSPPYTWTKVVAQCLEPQFDVYFFLNEVWDDPVIITTVPYVNLRAHAAAHGSVEVKCVDSCGAEVTQEVRCTTGEWWGKGYYECEVPGDYQYYLSNWIYREKGCTRNGQRGADSRSGTGNCDTCNAPPYPPLLPSCLTWDCAGMFQNPSIITCDYPRCRSGSSDFCSNHWLNFRLDTWK